jgi:hypothetical protein
MDEKGANIDLLFRNGLKDFEVLPPPGLWYGIHSAIKVKNRPIIYLRAAAVVTVLLTMSFLAYRWSREMSFGPAGSVIAFNVPVSSPVIYNPIENTQFLPEKKNNIIKSTSNFLLEAENHSAINEEIETIASPEQILNIPETKSLYLTKNETISGLELKPLNSSKGNPITIHYPDLQYPPVNAVVKPVNRWSIGAMASPTYYSSFNSGNEEQKQLSSSEQPLISYSGGVAFSYKINKKFSIQSGLYYSSLGQKIDGVNSYDGFQRYVYTKGVSNFKVYTTNGIISTSNPDVFLTAVGTDKVETIYTSDVYNPVKENLQSVSSSLNQNFSYLELPVVLRYKIVDKSIGINLVGGLIYNLLVNNSVYTTVDGSKYSIGKTDGLNSHTLSSSLGLGMEYSLSGNFSINLEPTFRYYLSPLSSTTSSFIHSYSFGIFSGVSYKF